MWRPLAVFLGSSRIGLCDRVHFLRRRRATLELSRAVIPAFLVLQQLQLERVFEHLIFMADSVAEDLDLREQIRSLRDEQERLRQEQDRLKKQADSDGHGESGEANTGGNSAPSLRSKAASSRKTKNPRTRKRSLRKSRGTGFARIRWR